MDFYNRLNYSLGNEDWHVEEQALSVKSNNRVVCVTASGDRPLHLLMTPCAEIISIDMNPIQNFLLELKMAALYCLDYEKYLAFLGCHETSDRLNIFNSLKSHLSSEAAAFWVKNLDPVRKGIIYQGRVERLLYLVSKCLNLIKHKQIKTLLSFSDIEAQRKFIAEKWDTYLWKGIFQIFLNPKIMKLIINDPGVVSHIGRNVRPGNYIYDRMLAYLNNNLARKSALLQLILLGKVLPEAYFPYLTFEGYNKIRKNIAKLTFKTVNIIDYINRPQTEKFDCFSMSDIASYMPQESFNKLLTGIHHAANPDARFCIRKLMSNHAIPTNLERHFKRDQPLEKKLEQEESNFVYRFMVGHIDK